jgi:SNF2 family DNA or RNA helicase
MEIENEIKRNGFEKSQIKILSILTRLRQICCHPAFFLEDYHKGSGKLELLQELISDALEANHRIIVYSQWVEMLQIIRKMLDDLNYEYFYLDGSTKSDERIDMVNKFNSGERSIFLISLKAGGL